MTVKVEHNQEYKMNTNDRKLFSLLLDEMKGMRAELADLKAPMTIKHEAIEVLEKPIKGKAKKTTKKVTVESVPVELKSVHFNIHNIDVECLKGVPSEWQILGAVNHDKEGFQQYLKDYKPEQRIIAYSRETGLRNGKNIPCFGIAKQ